MANAHLDNGDPLTAAKVHQKAINLNPNYTSAYKDVAKAFQMTGDQQNAIKSYSQAIHLGNPLAQPTLQEADYLC